MVESGAGMRVRAQVEGGGAAPKSWSRRLTRTLQAVSGRYPCAFGPGLLGRARSEHSGAPGPEEGWDARAFPRGPRAFQQLERPGFAGRGGGWVHSRPVTALLEVGFLDCKLGL